MYKGKFTSELSMNEVKEYYDELRRKFPRTEEQWADFTILQEKLITFAYKILDGKINDLEVITAIENGIPFQEICDRENSEIKNEIKELFERVENIEKQMKEEKEAQLEKLKAELDHARLCCALSDVTFGRSDYPSHHQAIDLNISLGRK